MQWFHRIPEEIKKRYDHIWSLYEEMAEVVKDYKWGFIDINGKISTPIIYDSVGIFNKGKTEVCLDGIKFFINLDGEKI